jgi:glycosyltransferase involved in cell wall biosynthesis
MKLIIQIPCLNEAEALPVTLAALPRHVPGFDRVEWLIIDDGSTDDTVEVAFAHGVDHVVSLPHNQGLAKAFSAGLDACVRLGADVIINTDADNQYDAGCIPDLARPILEKKAQIVVGARPIDSNPDFSPLKKALQKIGSWAVRLASGTNIPDAPSGFRAIHREAAMRLFVFNDFTYTLETIIQAGRKNIPITWVPVQVNGFLRSSRLIRSIPSYLFRSIVTIVRVFVLYKPLRFFFVLAAFFALPAVIALGRFLIFYLAGEGQGHVQSVAIASGFLSVAAVLGISGILGDLIAANRSMLEDLRAQQARRDVDMNSGVPPSERIPFYRERPTAKLIVASGQWQ